MTVLPTKKSSNNNRDNSTNQQQQQSNSSTARVRPLRDEEQTTSTNLSAETNSENSTSAASSLPPTTTTTTMNDFSSGLTTSPNCYNHSKRKSHYPSHHLPQTITKQTRRRQTSDDQDLATSSNSDSSNDDSLPENSSCTTYASITKTNANNTTDQCNSEDEYEVSTSKNGQENLDEREISFAQVLKEKKGFIIKRVQEDGACLFRAVSDQVFGDEEMHGTVRQHCMDYIVKNSDFFRAYITEDFDRYVTRKRRENCHGNHIEMIALSELYNRPIEVYEYSLEPINVVQGMYKTDNEPIRLSYHRSVHYNSIIDPWKPTAGHGLGLPDLQPGHAQESLIVNALKESDEKHIEQTILEDQIATTDWEATQDELIQQIAHESYLQWLKDTSQQSTENSIIPSANSTADVSENSTNANLEDLSKTRVSLNVDGLPNCRFTLPYDYDEETALNSALDNDDSLMEQAIALSRLEYMESLKTQSQSNKSADSEQASSSSSCQNL